MGAGRTKKYAMEQAFKTFTQQMNAQNNPFGNAAFSPGSPFPFPPTATPTSNSSSTSTPAPSQPVSIDVPATKVEDPPFTSVKENVEPEKTRKKYDFIDVIPEETLQKSSFKSSEESIQPDSPSDPQSSQPDSQNGTASKQGAGASQGPSTSGSSGEMMEDPTVQKMLLARGDEESYNLQIPSNNMGGSPELDNRMVDSLKNFDLSIPEIKQQFVLTHEEVISKIMVNPDIAMAIQNPRVQTAIMECSQNPLAISKYQIDKEVTDVFTKISEPFPWITGS